MTRYLHSISKTFLKFKSQNHDALFLLPKRLSNSGGSQVPLVLDRLTSWEETIYIRLSNKTSTPVVSPVLTADTWNTPELLQLSIHGPTCQVKFGLISLGWGWLGTAQSLWTVTLSVTCVSACPSHEPKQSALKTRAASHLRFCHWACLQRAQLFLGSSIPIPPWCVDSTLSTHAI